MIDKKAMLPMQIRLPEKIVLKIDRIIKKGHYTSRSELVRDAVRRFIEKR